MDTFYVNFRNCRPWDKWTNIDSILAWCGSRPGSRIF